MTFESYKFPQLVKIVISRLEGLKVFEPDAIQFCARKVSQISGDARRCLDVCRYSQLISRAVEIHSESNDDGLVMMDHIQKAIKEMNSSKSVKAVQNASLHQRIFLLAIINASRKCGTVDVVFSDVVDEHESICRLANIAIPYMSNLYSICGFLGQYHLTLVESAKQGDPNQKIKLNINEQDVVTGAKLSQHAKLSRILKKYN